MLKILSITLCILLLGTVNVILYQKANAVEDNLCKTDCSAPTLGLGKKLEKKVASGVSYNGKQLDVNEFFTPFPQISVEIGKENIAIFKIFDDEGPNSIMHFDLAFGLSKDQTIQDSKARIEWERVTLSEEKVTIIDPENVFENVRVESDIGSCGVGKNQCLILKIYHTFRAPLEFDIVGTNVWDMKRNAWQNYFNHGVHITGKSLNPVKTVNGIDKGHIYHLTKTDKNTAIDELGNTWTFDKGWVKNIKPIVKEPIQLTNKFKLDALKRVGYNGTTDIFGYTRTDSGFTQYKDAYMQKTEERFNILFPKVRSIPFEEINNTKSYVFSIDLERLDPKIINAMKREADSSQSLLSALMKQRNYYESIQNFEDAKTSKIIKNDINNSNSTNIKDRYIYKSTHNLK